MFTENVQKITQTKVLRAFSGSPTTQMPELLADDRTLLDLKGVMERRLGSNEDAQALRNMLVTTSSPLLVAPNGDVIVTSADNPVTKPLVEGLNPKSKLKGYSLVVDESVYEAAKQGEHMVIDAKKAAELRDEPYSNSQLREEFFEFQARDSKLAQEYGKLVKELTGRDINSNRGLWLPNHEGMRLFWVGSCGDNYSGADGNVILVSYYGRLVGVSNEVASAGGASARSVDDLVRNVPEDSVKAVLQQEFGANSDYASDLLKKITSYKTE